MISASKKEFCAAGNGAEFSDNKPVVIYGIMIKHIVFLKTNRVVFKIIVYCIISDLNIGLCYRGLKINRLFIAGAGIYFVFRNCHKSS